MNTRLHLFIAAFIGLASTLSAQSRQDTIFNYATETAVTIDGVASEACWQNAEWNDINQVWMPYDATMADGDFEGRFKTAWDGEYLYVLVEVVDDSLSDDHSDPLSQWWDDDCLEIFIDEDYSGGWHQNDENAFAYHLSIFYDAIDLGASDGVNYKEHVNVVMDTIADNTYLWEMAIKIYNDSYNDGSPENSRVSLSNEKIMGFTIAYCDNDETDSRENFIGSVELPANKNNICYQDASYFGTMKLVGSSFVQPAALVVTAIEGKVSEDEHEASFSIKLNKEPQSTVTVNISSGTTSEVVVDPAQLTFTISDWQTAQTVTLTGVNDDDFDGDQNVTIDITVDPSSDDEFAALSNIQFSIKNADNDEESSLVSDFTNDLISIAPNPASDFLLIQNKSNNAVDISIYNLSGQLVFQNNIENTQRVDISWLSAGTYSVRIVGTSINTQQLLIKL